MPQVMTRRATFAHLNQNSHSKIKQNGLHSQQRYFLKVSLTKPLLYKACPTCHILALLDRVTQREVSDLCLLTNISVPTQHLDCIVATCARI
eukprot:m.186411 g.186411  ORF g.186411 m.186411 type:complete len:92 (-) comp14754_c0_seq13:2079-2354(-)